MSQLNCGMHRQPCRLSLGESGVAFEERKGTFAVVLLVVALVAAAASRAADQSSAGAAPAATNALELRGEGYRVKFASKDGAIEYAGPLSGNQTIYHSGLDGLWSARFADGRRLTAAEFRAGDPKFSFQAKPIEAGRGLHLDYRAADLDVAIDLVAHERWIDARAVVSARREVLLEFALPARLEFAPEQLVRLVTPWDGNQSVGMALRGGFFSRRPPAPGANEPTKKPGAYYQYGTNYPPALADFFHWETRAGKAAVYRAHARSWEPWQAARDPQAMFVPGRMAVGGSERGGWCERPFATYVASGKSWHAPPVRLAFGRSAAEELRTYAQANSLGRSLADKLPAPLRERFPAALLVYYSGSAAQKLQNLERLPKNTLIHFADYLHGGFDKQYPDHLPPRADFGSSQEFRLFLERARKLGHLVMPYTNPTWWCDAPRGPTFLKHGEGPLLRTLAGDLVRERYDKNEGYTICYWHPAVQAANRKTVVQFQGDYPVDVLFQDQCGARGWRYDSNPASPTPAAYVEGLLSMLAEDCRAKPLSTESGWDGVVEFESQLCGMTWSLVPTTSAPRWRRLAKERFDPSTWEVFPLIQYLAHDKVAMVHHDLGQFVTNRQVLAWTLGLGFGLSYRVDAYALQREPPRQWLAWLDRLQKLVAARYVGQPLDEFVHRRMEGAKPEEDGLLVARYGDLKVVANLDPYPREQDGVSLAAFGFHVTRPGMVAGSLNRVGSIDLGGEALSFIARQQDGNTEAWIYAAGDQPAAVLLPGPCRAKAVKVRRYDADRAMAEVLPRGAAPPKVRESVVEVPATVSQNVLQFRLPPDRAARVSVPAELNKPPRDWPGARPAIGVLELNQVIPTWTRIRPADWLTSLRRSRLATEFGLPIRTITSADALVGALKAGSTQWLAIINPYGERFPCTGPGQWPVMLDLIRNYVNRGGCWWETGGYSFHQAVAWQQGAWRPESVGPAGLQRLGLLSGDGEIDRPPEPLRVTAEGQRWLGEALAKTLAGQQAMVNRGLPGDPVDPGHLTLLRGTRADYLGGYRLEGWGWFWRVGGFWPEPDILLPAVVAILERVYTQAPAPTQFGGARYLWHAAVESP